MKKYGDYTIEDFLLDSTFVEWVKSEGYRNHSHPWTQWYQQHPSQQYLGQTSTRVYFGYRHK
jgi:hypothetical protein